MKFEVPKLEDIDQTASEQISKRIGRVIKIKIGSRTHSTYPLTWGAKNITAQSTIFAYEIPENKKALYMQCIINMKTKYTVYSSKWNTVAENIGIPFLVDVSDLPDDFDSNENLPLFQKKVEERLSDLWPNDEEKDSKDDVENDEEKDRKKVDDAKESKKGRVKINVLIDDVKDNKDDVKDNKDIENEEITDAKKNEEKDQKKKK